MAANGLAMVILLQTQIKTNMGYKGLNKKTSPDNYICVVVPILVYCGLIYLCYV